MCFSSQKEFVIRGIEFLVLFTMTLSYFDRTICKKYMNILFYVIIFTKLILFVHSQSLRV